MQILNNTTSQGHLSIAVALLLKFRSCAITMVSCKRMPDVESTDHEV